MSNKVTTTREKLIDIIAKAMREKSKSMGDETNIKFPIRYENWQCGMGRDARWSNTDITLLVNSKKTTYTFTDKEITQRGFIDMLNKALEKSKVKGRVVYDEQEVWHGYHHGTEYCFKRVELFSNPCKEFNTLRKYLEKHANFKLGDMDVFSVDVCGKRSSWGDSGDYYYLCYDPKRCKRILYDIKYNKGSKDLLKVSTEKYLDHGDDMEYQCAMYQESEWYGHRGNKLCIEVTTPKGKVKLNEEYYR